ncbi:hypothetical protein ZHAS_00019679 [Anopheles sinensis]|uniref:Uncharacterized protein n=1 Tax=Anopheles sinensis TaxID=74873 RepID=A0A084WN12_ANOSI|nr:hypothetical protein ZHAS_00019679 [Anopheles sinensis]
MNVKPRDPLHVQLLLNKPSLTFLPSNTQDVQSTHLRHHLWVHELKVNFRFIYTQRDASDTK